jgi:hypothetical protein
MTRDYYLKKNNDKTKDYKYSITYINNDTGRENIVHFGNRHYEDLTQHHDHNRKILYENRHKTKENWNDLTTAGAWAKNLLWNKISLSESIKDTEKKFNIKIHY